MVKTKIIDEINLYKIDLIQTVLANLINILFLFGLLIFFAMFSTQVMRLESDVNRLLGFIIELFVFGKVVTWLIHPKFCYKERSMKKC